MITPNGKSAEPGSSLTGKNLFEILFRMVSARGLWLTLGLSLGLFVYGKRIWACGILVGAAWMYLNCFFLVRVTEIGFGYRKNSRGAVPLLLFFKFPVIYGAGYFILVSRFFPVFSLVAGITVFFVAFAIAWSQWVMAGQKVY